MQKKVLKVREDLAVIFCDFLQLALMFSSCNMCVLLFVIAMLCRLKPTQALLILLALHASYVAMSH